MGKFFLGVIVGILLCKPYLVEASWAFFSNLVQNL